MGITQFLLGPFIIWLPALFFFTIFLVWQYKTKNYRWLIWGVIAFRFVYSLALTIIQYLVWQETELTKYISRMPVDQIVPSNKVFNFLADSLFNNKIGGYFLYYAYGRFWLNLLVTVFFSLMIFGFICLLNRYQKRKYFFSDSWQTLLFSLLLGWPDLLFFLPAAILGAFLGKVINFIIKKKYFIDDFSFYFVFAFLLIFFFGSWLINLFNLSVLNI